MLGNNNLTINEMGQIHIYIHYFHFKRDCFDAEQQNLYKQTESKFLPNNLFLFTKSN